MKKIAHIDLNAFYAQAEILRDPSLRGKPVAIGYEGRRGVVATASYEAREYQIYSGMPMSMARKNCPTLIVVNGDHAYYSMLSKKFMGYLKKRFPIMEQASIDECYIDMTKEIGDNNESDFLFDLQMKLYKATGLKCSIGLGDNRFLAKMGSDYKKPLGLTIIHRADVEKILWPLAIDKMYGIGKKTAPRLHDLGIHTIGDLAVTQDSRVKKVLGSSFTYVQGEANGYGNDEVDTSAFDPKSISAERTFSTDASSYEELHEMILVCVKEVYFEALRYHKEASVVSLKLRTSDFVTKTKRITLEKPIHEREDILKAAMTIFDSFYNGQPLRLIGVCLEKVNDMPAENVKSNAEDNQKTIEDINSKLAFGGKLFLASEIAGKKNDENE